MIRQEDIEKGRFFTVTGGDIWRVKKVRLITEVELHNCETGRMETCRVGEKSAERFIAIVIPTVKRETRDEGRGTKGKRRGRPPKTSLQKAGDEGRGTKSKQRGRPPKKRKIKLAGQSPAIRREGDKRGCRKGKPPSSQYFGVTVKQEKSGPRYYAQCHRGGKFKGLGIHKVEELAAAAVQEHLGNHTEAERLRKIAEQKTDIAIKELKGDVGPVRFLCAGCGADYEQKLEKCVKCGGGSFEKIRSRQAG